MRFLPLAPRTEPQLRYRDAPRPLEPPGRILCPIGEILVPASRAQATDSAMSKPQVLLGSPEYPSPHGLGSEKVLVQRRIRAGT